jgi:ribosomal protein L11 methyltransferase
MCLNLLELLLDRVLPADVLDAGTGSGILSIAAARLGARKVTGMEVDSDAVKCAGKNIRLNRVQDRITIRHDDLINVRGLYDLVLANLGPKHAADYGEHLIKHLKAPGHLIISGLSGFEVSRTLKRLRDGSGLRVWKRSWDQGWTALGLYKG